MILEDAAVEHGVIVFPVEHSLNVVRVLPELALHQYIFTIHLRQRLGVLGINDDRPHHAAGDVLDHRLDAAVVKEHAGLFGNEGDVVGLAALHRLVIR